MREWNGAVRIEYWIWKEPRGDGQGQQCCGVYSIATVSVQRPESAELVGRIRIAKASEGLSPAFEPAAVRTPWWFSWSRTSQSSRAATRSWLLRPNLAHVARPSPVGPCQRAAALGPAHPAHSGSFFFTATFLSDTYAGIPSLPYGG